MCVNVALFFVWRAAMSATFAILRAKEKSTVRQRGNARTKKGRSERKKEGVAVYSSAFPTMLHSQQLRCAAVALAIISSLVASVSGFQAHGHHHVMLSSPLTRPRHWTSQRALSSSDDDEGGNGQQPKKKDNDETFGSQLRRSFLASSAAAVTYAAVGPLGLFTPPGYERVSPLQFIAALGDPEANSGGGTGSWGIWETDPGPRGFRQREYEKVASGELRPPKWFQEQDFYLDENAIIMPQPSFPLPEGKYLVTGGRIATTGLTISGDGTWKLDSGKLYDVTHLPCRAARYRGGTPSSVRKQDFPVAPGAIMPEVPGTTKQDYSVLFVVGKAKAKAD